MRRPQIRPIPGHELYGASRDGRIWRIVPHPRFPKTSVGPRSLKDAQVPYALKQFHIGRTLCVKLNTAPRGPLTVASLVATAYLPATDTPRAVAFKNGDSQDCSVRNLAWGGHKRSRRPG